MKKLSVITINYNNCDGLKKTVKSVISQNIKDFEYIIIDGGSTDGSIDVIKTYSDRIDYWVSEPDRGIYNAMNKGIDVASGEYCIFLNSGDSFYDYQTLSLCIPGLDGTDVLAGHVQLDTGKIEKSPMNITIQSLYNHQQPCHQSSFIKTELLKKYHYDEKYKLVSDWKFFIQVFIFDNCSYKSLDIIVSIYDTDGISSINRSLIDKEHVCVLRDDFPKKIYDYYIYNTETYGAKLYNVFRRSKCYKIFDKVSMAIYKLVKLFNFN